MRSLTFLLALMLAACASKKDKDNTLDVARANTRALEQVRMRAVTSGDAESGRGAQVMVADPEKTFDPNSARFGAARSISTRSSQTQEFHFEDRVRTKSFTSKEYASKAAWLGDAKFATKEAPTKKSWFANKSASTKSYETREARDAGKVAATRALPGGDRPFLVQGRRQADLDATGKSKIPFGTYDMGPSWSGELKELTIDDVKSLLNKN